MTTIPVGDDLRTALLACLAVPRWADEVTGQAPFASAAALIDAARAAATPLPRSEIDQAMAEHPRIGEKPRGTSQAAGFSRAEQASEDADDADLAAAIADGNRVYEERFDRVFLIRAAGRSRREILAELERRLTLDDATEAAIVGSELRDIALLRLGVLALRWQDDSVQETEATDSAAPRDARR
ncbi:2-oxo-4-hydroxy-4-carboxy-5-ureidoimidazoline decarboxylase [Cryobacterium adonitolivorans]|uniref:2-oxo-4-hydroxy-4-carboxy-5-ureidoimidazoline decarboxylase n=1 Tax=Cryobacterium adonitolivorans TaxID=1259189 RepID=A0A4R8WGG3_9MICO|nr:2-oxo-4-hydroxy-4-carboxy-5-ureidoimidazoline decarboxylase [Cryobacterium adonitolivorans]TFC07074.1 2-oxo-4-hydroxy-4-carboxy-5-ureidoimidazoline decarboxylase [Cryobacterium adonitolivorans]